MHNIKNIVFDLGGVIITLDKSEAVRRFEKIGLGDVEKLLNAYHQKGVFLELEEGKISKEIFYDHLKNLTSNEISTADIDNAFLGFLKEVPHYKLEMLTQLRKKYNLYLLSNTNPIMMEWALSSRFSPDGRSLADFFDKLYLSYKIGYTKPDPRIFDYMIADSGLVPEETLFIDDAPSNIEAGKKIGMHTFQPENGSDFRDFFTENGL